MAPTEQPLITVTGDGQFYVVGNTHIDGIWFDERGRGHKYSCQRTPEGKIIKRKGKLPPEVWPPA